MKRSLLFFAAIIVLALCLLLSSCLSNVHKGSTEKNDITSSDVQKELDKADQNAVDVTIIQLIASPEKYNGELIRVIGVGNLEFEGNYLSLSKEDHKYGTGNQIWIELSNKAIPYDEAQEYNGKYVIVEGIFDKDDLGHLSMFHGTIKDISRYELWEHE